MRCCSRIFFRDTQASEMVNDKKIYDTFARYVSQYVVKIAAFLHLEDHLLPLLCYPRPGVTRLGLKEAWFSQPAQLLSLSLALGLKFYTLCLPA